jgi:hypothetical protein
MMEIYKDACVRVEQTEETRVVLKIYARCNDCGCEMLDELLDRTEASIRVGVFRRLGSRCHRCLNKMISSASVSG